MYQRKKKKTNKVIAAKFSKDYDSMVPFSSDGHSYKNNENDLWTLYFLAWLTSDTIIRF